MSPAKDLFDMRLSVAEQFSRFPAGRYPSDGPFNGERFREQLLIPALKDAIASGDRVVVELDGALGYSSSFLEEVFGGLTRAIEFDPAALRKALEISAGDIAYEPARLDAERYLSEGLSRRRA